MNLPHDRPMTAEERRGFQMACACFVTWGRQIELNGFRLGGETTPVPGHKVMQHAGRMVRFCAEALDRTIGQSGGAR
jgi:hypothetical protein